MITSQEEILKVLSTTIICDAHKYVYSVNGRHANVTKNHNICNKITDDIIQSLDNGLVLDDVFLTEYFKWTRTFHGG